MKISRLLISLILLFSVALTGCGSGAPEVGAGDGGGATPTPYPTPVRPTFTVQRGDISVDAKLLGHVEPLALETLYFEMGGQVSDVYAKVGDVIEEGQLLAELAELKELEAQADASRREIRRAQIGLEIATLVLEKYKSQGASDFDIKMQEYQVELAQMTLDETVEKLGIDPDSGALEELDAQVAKGKLFADMPGTLISAVTVGRNVSPTTAAFVLGDPAQLEVVADVTDAGGDDQLKEMFEGMTVSVVNNARPDQPMTGTIRQLPSPYGTGAQDDRTVRIVMDQAPSVDTFQTGDKMTINVPLANKTGVLWLPPDAIRQAGGRTFVIVDSENGPKRVDVTLGLQTRDMIEIVSGLSEGQVVVGQ